MSTNKINTNLSAINGGQDIVILVAKTVAYPYINGKRSDAPNGFKFDVALQGNKLTPLSVKIEGVDPLPQVTEEVLTAATVAGKFIYARIIDCTVSIYTMNGNMGMAATAKGIEVLNASK